MSSQLDFADKNLLDSIQQLLSDKKNSAGISFEELDGGEGRTARDYVKPGYLSERAPLQQRTVKCLKGMLDKLNISNEHVLQFHQNRSNHFQQNNTQNQQHANQNGAVQQNISFNSCDFSSPAIIGNQSVTINNYK